MKRYCSCDIVTVSVIFPFLLIAKNDMNWWNHKKKIPTGNKNFIQLFSFFVFECPACRRIGGGKKEGKRKAVKYVSVSARANSFRARGIDRSLLTTILAEIRRPLATQSSYAALKKEESVEDYVKSICKNTQLKDPSFDLMVYHKRSEMSEAEAIYYYIRNAFAHGAFDVTDNSGSVVYHFESKKDDTVHAQMRIKEKTLRHYMELAKMHPEDIRLLQKQRK